MGVVADASRYIGLERSPVVTREIQYGPAVAESREVMGPLTSDSWRRDPKHLLFTLSRYKFVAKCLAGRRRVLEVGCGDGFGSRLVAQEVGKLTATDWDPVLVASAIKAQPSVGPQVDFKVWDPTAFEPFIGTEVQGKFDAVYALDVLEHIPHAQEARFLHALTSALALHSSACIIGMPSKVSQQHASEISRAGHVNCKSANDLAHTLRRNFGQVFIFSMNDEVVHTGFHAMAHYYLALAVN